MQLPRIADLSPGVEGWGFFLCADKFARSGRGGDYVGLLLQDASGALPARIFENVERFRDEFEAGEFVKVTGRVQGTAGRLLLVVDHIRRVLPDQDRAAGFSEERLVPTAPRPIAEMWAELQQEIAAITSPHLRALVQAIVAEQEPRLRVWPAARTIHHAYRGGLLEHVLQMTRAGRALARLYGADEDLVVAGALLHDIGKTEELEYELTTSYTRDGNLIGHIALGTMMVHDACRRIPGFPEALRTALLHLIASHHGSKERGSPVEPMTMEAIILSAVDELDATLNQVRRAMDEPAEGEFTPYQGRLGRAFWRGGADPA